MESSTKLSGLPPPSLPPLPDVTGPKWLLCWQARKYLEARIGPLAKSRKEKVRNLRQGELAFIRKG